MDKPVAHCAFTDKPPVIDGDLSDACWKKVEPVSGFYLPNTPQKAELPTTFMALYDGTHLYLAVTAQEDKPIDPATRKDANIIRDKYVSRYSYELFLAPRDGACYQLVWDVNGIRYDGDWLDKKWDGRWQAAARIAGDTVTSEVSIELASLGVSAMEPGAQWGLNLMRNGENSCAGCWSPISGGYHNPATFGALLIGSREVYWSVQGEALQQRLQKVTTAHGGEIGRHPLLRPLSACVQSDHAIWKKAAYPDASVRWGAFRQLDYRVEALEIFFEWKQKLNGGQK